MSEHFSTGDKVRSPVFAGIGQIISIETNARGRKIATVKLEKGFHDNLSDTGPVTVRNLRPAELPGYDLEFTAPRGSLSQITPALIRDVRADPRIGEAAQDDLDQILVETAIDPGEWADGVAGLADGLIGIILRVAREKGLL